MRVLWAMVLACCVSACVSVPPVAIQWADLGSFENEYEPYLKSGTSSIQGQAFLTQRNGGVVKGAGRVVTLDPATAIGTDWWLKAGKTWVNKDKMPPSDGFIKARRSVTADADGKFRFLNIPAGRYYVRTEVTWEIGNYYPTQGGLVGTPVDVLDGKSVEIVLNEYPK